MKRIMVALCLITVLLALAGCGGGSAAPTSATSSTPSTQMPGTEVKVSGGSYWAITPAELYGFKVKDFFLVNVDTAPDTVLASTDLFIKPEDVAQNLDKFPADKNTKIVVYCIAGVNSVTVAEALVGYGYTRVMELGGGTMRWLQQGYPAVKYTAAP